MSTAHHALSQITPTEAHTLLKFMQGHIPEPRKLDPAMTPDQNRHLERLMDKVRLVLSFRADAKPTIAAAVDLVNEINQEVIS
jgi:hypothetical protein